MKNIKSTRATSKQTNRQANMGQHQNLVAQTHKCRRIELSTRSLQQAKNRRFDNISHKTPAKLEATTSEYNQQLLVLLLVVVALSPPSALRVITNIAVKFVNEIAANYEYVQ